MQRLVIRVNMDLQGDNIHHWLSQGVNLDGMHHQTSKARTWVQLDRPVHIEFPLDKLDPQDIQSNPQDYSLSTLPPPNRDLLMGIPSSNIEPYMNRLVLPSFRSITRLGQAKLHNPDFMICMELQSIRKQRQGLIQLRTHKFYTKHLLLPRLGKISPLHIMPIMRLRLTRATLDLKGPIRRKIAMLTI
jgi:hypothetical protein